MSEAQYELIQPEPRVYDHRLVDEIAARLEGGRPEDILRWAFEEFGDRVTIATGFGAEGVALVDLAVRINPRADVFFLDTSFLFHETYELRRRLEGRYGIEIRAFQTRLTPDAQELTFGPKLWAVDPDLCCRLRKLEPLREALKGKAAWVTAIRRSQTAERATAGVVEWDYQWKLVKINPLAGWSKADVWGHIRENDLPYNPLHERGYPSIGCTHCTRAVTEGEDERAGRWSNFAKTECGLHNRPNA
jgi:phosphoadenosine phosphosulfate reductase